MSIRPKAIRWLKSNYGDVSGTICTSKFYQPKESWTNNCVWWLEIPLSKLSDTKGEIHFICQILPNKEEYYYLKIPVNYFIELLSELKILNSKKISLFLSAESKNMFQDERGFGKVHFNKFLVNG